MRQAFPIAGMWMNWRASDVECNTCIQVDCHMEREKKRKELIVFFIYIIILKLSFCFNP